jgi:hypothetical protein
MLPYSPIPTFYARGRQFGVNGAGAIASRFLVFLYRCAKAANLHLNSMIIDFLLLRFFVLSVKGLKGIA